MSNDPRGRGAAFLEFWRERHLCTLTTVRPDGTAHVVAVGVTLDAPAGLARVITSRRSRKVGLLAGRGGLDAAGRVAAAGAGPRAAAARPVGSGGEQNQINSGINGEKAGPSAPEALAEQVLEPAGGGLAMAAGRVGVPVAVCQIDGRRWSTIEGLAVVRDDPGSVAEAERRYAERYRTPRANPDRVVVEITITRILGSV
ncbi:pyridoxamine 5'-phosphate oxidase family protein [Parafrankia discariae]|uniref:pyridoxamine 5'-phosphate oxidase family protein n=1 Tax=Parafrankia discariae TaxID=365528 RepID=UPI0003639629|nr:pyridoxamine 5'-phosphate oxidase family protein [Parafrankia discariae]